MDRRTLILRIAATLAATGSISSIAQGPAIRAMPVVGFLNSGSPDGYEALVASFRQGLREAGFTEGQNVTLEFQWARSRNEQLPELAMALVRRNAAVITGLNSTAAVQAMKAATSSIPGVFAIGADPVKVGLVASFNRPGGNITGVSFLSNTLVQKRFELLRELLPRGEVAAFLLNPNNPNAGEDTRSVQAAAAAVGWKLVVAKAAHAGEIEKAFASIARSKASAMLVNVDPLFISERKHLVALARRQRLPAMYDRRDFVLDGGLISYGTSLTEVYRQVGLYTGRILKGESAAELPVIQASKFELVLNESAARTLKLAVPDSLRLRVDEVIR